MNLTLDHAPAGDPVPILLASYYFPPHGGAGTQRFAGFARDLPAHGYRPIVLTAEPAPRPNAPDLDPTLRNALPADLVVHRVPAADSTTAGARFGFRVDEEAWVRAATPTAMALAREHSVEAVITTVSPYALATLGRDVARKIGVPWILDLRDPWALDGWRSYPTRWHALWERRLMRSALRDADVVIANTPAAGAAYRDLVPSTRLTVIPNGFDPVPATATRSSPASGRFRIVHVGTLHDPMLPGPDTRVRWRTVHRATRSARTLIEAAGLLRARRPDIADQLSIELIGRVHPDHARLATACRVADLIRLHGYLPHDDAVAQLADADACFVPLHDVAPGDRALVVPGKLYEALASGTPVLACLPPGDASDLVRALGAGTVLGPRDVDGLARAIARRCDDRTRVASDRPVSTALLEPFTRPALAGRLASAIDAARDPALALPADDPWSHLAPHTRSTAPVPLRRAA